MKHLKIVIMLCMVSLFISCSNKERNKNELVIADKAIETVTELPEEKSLFERLGGTEGISTIIDDIVDAHLKNPVIKDKFAHLAKDPAKMKLVKVHLKEFLSAGTGGGAEYTGKDLVSAHTGFNISDQDFLSATDDILDVLNAHLIDEETKKDMLYILYSMKDAVMHK